jgi:hypothetical protein
MPEKFASPPVVMAITNKAKEQMCHARDCQLREAMPAPLPKPKPGQHHKLNGEALSLLVDHLKQHPLATLQQLCTWFRVQSTFQQPLLAVHLKTLNKGITLIPHKWNEQPVLDAWVNYVLHDIPACLSRCYPVLFNMSVTCYSFCSL